MTDSVAHVAATVLAAGVGARLGGRPKSALQLDGVSLISRLIASIRSAGVQDVRVVVGPYAQVLTPLVLASGATPLLHELAAPTLIDSQRLAMQCHLRDTPASDVMMLVADLPWLQAAHVSAVLQAWQARPADTLAMMPVVSGSRGHPVMLSAQAARAIHLLPEGTGIRHWLSGHAEQVCQLPQSDQAFVSDLDTEADVEALRRAWHPLAVTWPIEVHSEFEEHKHGSSTTRGGDSSRPRPD